MLDHVQILAEGASHASEGGVPPILVGGAMFLFLLIMLGITYLFSGQNQRPAKTRSGARTEDGHESAASDARRH
jgi:hypothetical protein